MLEVSKLTERMKPAFEKYLCDALQQAVKGLLPEPSDAGNEMAETFANTVKEIAAAQMAECIAGAIDYYVRSLEVYGNIQTLGGPVMQAAVITTAPTIEQGGISPNVLAVK